MIKVLKSGYLKQVECMTCGALLEYNEKEDVKIDKIWSGYIKWILCPECNSCINLEATR